MKITPNPTTEFHILRHFNKIDQNYCIERLISKDYFFYDYNKKTFIKSKITPKHIELALETIGGKFTTNNHFENPLELISLINSQLKIISKKETVFHFDSIIGNSNTVSKKSINNQKLIKSIHRSELEGEDMILINSLSKPKNTTTTKDILIDIQETSNLSFPWVSIFPLDINLFNSKEEVVFLVTTHANTID